MRIDTTGKDVAENVDRRSYLLIWGSNILGAESLSSAGFNWTFAPFQVSSLASAIRRSMAIEQRWSDRVDQWLREGAIEARPPDAKPGVIGWFVELRGLERATADSMLNDVAAQIVRHVPHFTSLFDEDGQDAETIAHRLLETVSSTKPIPFGL